MTAESVLSEADAHLTETLIDLGDRYGPTGVADVARALATHPGHRWVQDQARRREILGDAIADALVGTGVPGLAVPPGSVDRLMRAVREIEAEESGPVAVEEGPE